MKSRGFLMAILMCTGANLAIADDDRRSEKIDTKNLAQIDTLFATCGKADPGHGDQYQKTLSILTEGIQKGALADARESRVYWVAQAITRAGFAHLDKGKLVTSCQGLIAT